jgi:hypothetical protein
MGKKIGCGICSKKLNIIEQTNTCRCGKVFCSNHRHSEDHSCSFDYKTQDLNVLASALNSGKSVPQKIESI